MRIATIGDVDQSLARFNLPDRQIPIRVSLVESTRRDLVAQAEAVTDALLDHLAPDGHELVLFDVNRYAHVQPLLVRRGLVAEAGKSDSEAKPADDNVVDAEFKEVKK